jgi:hypothetical protein
VYGLLGPVIVFCLLFPIIFSVSVSADGGGTTSVTITRYDAYGNVVKSMEVTWEQMRDRYLDLPIQGDNVTHYYCEGPNFDEARTFETLWDPTETGNIDSRDYGAAVGTDIKDLCNLVGGAQPGYTITAKSTDGWSRAFDYENVYTPDPRQGKIVVTWSTKDAMETGDGFVPDDYVTGMRILFFAENPDATGRHVFGDYDKYLTWPENRFYCYYDGQWWPTTSGPSGKWIDRIDIRPPNVISCDASGKTKEDFVSGDTVYVKGQGLSKNTSYNLWIQTEPAVYAASAKGDTVPGCKVSAPLSTDEDLSGSQESVKTDDKGDFNPVAVWTIDASALTEDYDIVADNQAAGTKGTFDINDGADSPGFQGFSVTGVPKNSTTTAPFWDLNNDHKCDIQDLEPIGLRWNKTGNPGWIKEDVNEDGIINICDVVTIGLHFGEIWP